MANKKIGLSIYRLILTFLMLKSCLFYLPMADILFGKDAIYPISDYVNSIRYIGCNMLLFDFSQSLGPVMFLLIIIVCGVLFLFGEFGWVSGMLLYTLFTILRLRNPFILDGSDNVIQVTLPFLIFADSYQYFVTNYYKKNKIIADLVIFFSPLAKTITSQMCCGLMIQIVFIYFFTALAKLQGSLWLNGTAVYYTMRVEEFRATEWNVPLTQNYLFVVLSTYFTLLWELAFPFLIWFKQTKFWIILFGIIFHVGIFIFMRIDNFSWIMIGSYAIFITDDEYRKIVFKITCIRNYIKRRIKCKDLKIA